VTRAGASRFPETKIGNPPDGATLGPHPKDITPQTFSKTIESASKDGRRVEKSNAKAEDVIELRPGGRRKCVLEPKVNKKGEGAAVIGTTLKKKICR
jgi:hypothetical protein